MTPLPTQSTATDAPAADPVFGLMTPVEPAAEDQDFDKVFREASSETEAAEEEKSATEKTTAEENSADSGSSEDVPREVPVEGSVNKE